MRIQSLLSDSILLTRTEELLGLSTLHGALLLKLEDGGAEDLLDLLRHGPPGLVVLRLGRAAGLHLGWTEESFHFKNPTKCRIQMGVFTLFRCSHLFHSEATFTANTRRHMNLNVLNRTC